MLVTLLLPSLNEEEGIKKTLDAIPFGCLKKFGYELEVLVIDGKSNDNTRKNAEEKGAKALISKRGYGRQYLMGFKHAKGGIIVTADSDNSYPIKEMHNYIKLLEQQNLDFISTNRFANMNKKDMKAINRMGNIFLTFLTNILFDLKLKDSQSGMWILKKSALDKIRLTSQGMALSEEIKIEAFKNLKAKEVPSTYSKRIGSVKLKILNDGINNLLFLIKKRLFMNT